jgi:hypothetical protein
VSLASKALAAIRYAVQAKILRTSLIVSPDVPPLATLCDAVKEPFAAQVEFLVRFNAAEAMNESSSWFTASVAAFEADTILRNLEVLAYLAMQSEQKCRAARHPHFLAG